MYGVGSLPSSCSIVFEIGHFGHIGQKALKSPEYWLKSTVFLRYRSRSPCLIVTDT